MSAHLLLFFKLLLGFGLKLTFGLVELVLLLNSFLFDKFSDVYSTPLCGCGESDQTMCHISFECKGSFSIPSDAAHQLRERIGEAETSCFPNMHVQDFCTILLNHSRDTGFMTLLSKCIQECACYLKSSVKLTP